MKQWSRALAVAVLLAPAWASAESLRLVDVLRSASAAHPDVDVARASVVEARAENRAARGAFDLKVVAEGGYAPLGKYGKPRVTVGLNQPTPLMGMELWTRYENGADFAPYDGGLVTSEAGRASLGLLVPLLQGRAIDSARLGRALSELRLKVTEQEQRQMRAQVLADAALHWWKWLVTGQKLEAYRDLLGQAEERRGFVEEQVEVGALPRMELVDNRRLLAARRARLSALDLEFQQLSLRLGLYRRGEQNEPRPAQRDELSALPIPTETAALDREKLLGSLVDAPAVMIYGLSLSMVEKELRSAKNDQLPRLDLELYTSQSFGAERPYSAVDSSLTETAAGGKLKFAWDVQRRKARGKAEALRAKISALEAKRRLLREEMTLALEGQMVALASQFEVFELSREATREAQWVSAAERESFEMGQSTILSVNLREQAAVEAYISELDAVFEYHRAWISLHELLGSDRVADYLPPGGQEVSRGGEN